MEMLQNRKRQHADELSQEDHPRDVPPAKKIKTRSETELEAWESWKYPPEFWDRLSKIALTRRALEELDRRTKAQRPPPSPALARTTTNPRDLARFTRHGGPDLRDLRGYPAPRRNHPTPNIMSSHQSPQSRGTQSIDPASTLPTSATTKTKKSRPQDRHFDQHMTDHQIYPTYSSQKPDLTHIRTALVVPRPSLSSSKFSDGAFEAFEKDNALAKDEDDTLVDVMPTILGPKNPEHPLARNTIFGNLEDLTDGTIVKAKPDIYYGAYPEQLARSARDKLAGHIVPSTMPDRPLAPNFFVEVKGPDGNAAVATRQARYDGAAGCRAMHSLQNYGKEEPIYDNNAYTFSSTYHAGTGTLQLYAHHPTAPVAPGGRPGYHMTQLDGYQITGNIKSFRDGVTAYRNMRDLAKRNRDDFIDAANTYTRQANVSTNHANRYIATEGKGPSQSSSMLDNGNSTTSLAASSYCTEQNSSKRSRQSRSPSSTGDSQLSKSQTGPSTGRRATSNVTHAISKGSGDRSSHWVTTYRRNAKLYK